MRVGIDFWRSCEESMLISCFHKETCIKLLILQFTFFWFHKANIANRCNNNNIVLCWARKWRFKFPEAVLKVRFQNWGMDGERMTNIPNYVLEQRKRGIILSTQGSWALWIKCVFFKRYNQRYIFILSLNNSTSKEILSAQREHFS